MNDLQYVTVIAVALFHGAEQHKAGIATAWEWAWNLYPRLKAEGGIFGILSGALWGDQKTITPECPAKTNETTTTQKTNEH